MCNYNKKIVFKPVFSIKTIYAAYTKNFNEVAMKGATYLYSSKSIMFLTCKSPFFIVKNKFLVTYVSLIKTI